MNIKKQLSALNKKVHQKAKHVHNQILDQVEDLHELTKKNYNMSITVDKDGVKKELKIDRPTRHTIKWKSKGH
ncbi:MAG: hypothetical protein LBV67_02180 [Streptococcaceae bacterium]|jgi:hypothetical protein|nr:hypothetical protein [Streptococcaceae bacterium]